MNARILVVDDDPIERALLSEYLGLAGYEVSAAEDGERALARSLEQRPDLVLLDVQMPAMCGFEVVRRMRELPPLRDVPVLFVTSVDAEQAKVRGLELGADDYITKPCAQAELLARVRAALRRGARGIGEHSIVGALEEVGLDTLLLTMQLSGRAARIRLHDVAAELFVGQEAIFSCSFLQRTGTEALQRMLLVGRGRFSVDFAPPPGDAPERALRLSPSLMDAMVAVDEARRLVGGNPVVGWGRGGAALEPLREHLPRAALDVVAALPGDIRDAALLVERAIRDQALRVIE